MKRVLFFTCEPGGAEVLIPLIKEMIKDINFEVITCGYGLAIDRLRKQNIAFNEIAPIKKDDYFIFEKYMPDIVITSATSLPQKDMSEKYIWHNAKVQGIKTIAFLDQWQNYAIRFSGIANDEYMGYQPDIINCINDIGRKEMRNLGFSNDKLLELGHPFLSTLKDIQIDKNFIRLKLGLQDLKKPIIVFVSEAIQENYGVSRGYTQYNSLDYLLSQDFIQDKQMIVKLHPKDNQAKFKKHNNIIFVQNEFTSTEILSIADYAIGMTSIMLIEAFILGVKTLSLQLNLYEDLLLLSRYEFINKISNDLHKLSTGDFESSEVFDYEFDYEKFIKAI